MWSNKKKNRDVGKSPARPSSSGKKDPTLAAIEKLKRERQQRRQSAERFRQDRLAEEERNNREGRPGDVDFQRMIDTYRLEEAGTAKPHAEPTSTRITIVVRKRPVSSKEVARHDFDVITCLNPRVVVHTCKLRVDGISKYLDNNEFAFDHTFSEADDTKSVYKYTVQPLVAHAFRRGRGTCFAYGQTGSGKTYTMSGVQSFAAKDMFRLASDGDFLRRGFRISVSFFEIYGGRCSDLLHGRTKVTIREDGSGHVVCQGLKEVTASSYDGMLALVERGNRARTTHATAANETSSRSHAICELVVRDPSNKLFGKVSLIDLAGSERAADTRHHNRQRRVESAEINKSLLALKECIRALDNGSSHIPFRAAKLTLVLKDSFVAKKAQVAMISTVSPVASAADHTYNTLRYADRVKEKAVRKGAGAAPVPAAGGGGGAGVGAGAGGAPAAGGLGRPASSPSLGGGPRQLRSGADGPVGRDGGPGPVRCSPLPGSPDDDKLFDKVSDSMSPQAAQLREVALAAKHGKITAQEKARVKDGILREALAGGRGVAVDDAVSDARGYGRRAEEADLRLSDVSDDAADSNDDDDDSEELRRDFKSPVGLPPSGRSRRDHGSGAGLRRASSAADARRGMPRELVFPSASPERVPSDMSPDDVGRRRRAAEESKFDGPSPAKDLKMMHATLRADAAAGRGDGAFDAKTSGELLALHEAVSMIVDEEEDLLNEHMAAIQENAELLTQEGQLLSQVQGRDVIDYDIDDYATKLHRLLSRKLEITTRLLDNLNVFRQHLALEEQVSSRLG